MFTVQRTVGLWSIFLPATDRISETPPDSDPRTGFGGQFDGRPQSDTHVGGREFGGLRPGNRHLFDD